jgi:hypothetical protein
MWDAVQLAAFQFDQAAAPKPEIAFELYLAGVIDSDPVTIAITANTASWAALTAVGGLDQSPMFVLHHR